MGLPEVSSQKASPPVSEAKTPPQKNRLGFVVLLIIGIGCLAVMNVGLSLGMQGHIGKINALIMMIGGGVAGVLALSASTVVLVKTRSQPTSPHQDSKGIDLSKKPPITRQVPAPALPETTKPPEITEPRETTNPLYAPTDDLPDRVSSATVSKASFTSQNTLDPSRSSLWEATPQFKKGEKELSDFIADLQRAGVLVEVESEEGGIFYTDSILDEGMFATKNCDDGRIADENASPPCFSSKNRYANIMPYHNNLPFAFKDLQSPYIHASMLAGGVIATQGPLQGTIGDFWALVWKYEVPLVIMATDLVDAEGRQKCARYWPEVGEKWIFGSVPSAPYIILKDEKEILPSIIKRILILSDGKEERKVEQLHIQKWGDFEALKSSILQDLVSSVEEHRERNQRVVCHCSAGIGRAGSVAFILIFKQLLAFAQEHKKQFSLDLTKFLTFLRTSDQWGRRGMIQTFVQYQSVVAYLKTIPK